MNDKTPPAAKKPKLVRDSFTIPKAEYAAIDELKARALTLGMGVKKSELLRAGLMVLKQLNDTRFKFALKSVPTIKTGRPTSLQISASFAPATVSSKPDGQPSITVNAAKKQTIVKKVAVKVPAPAAKNVVIKAPAPVAKTVLNKAPAPVAKKAATKA